MRRYRLPPNPAKKKDTRYEGYQAKFGNESWELDALDPDVIEQLIRDAIEPLIDGKKWKAAKAAENRNRAALEKVTARWPDVWEEIVNA